jgi:hypothetical protein
MFEPCNNVEELEKSILKTLENLEQENKQLNEEKANLLDIEAKLQARVSEEVDARKHENDGLKIEVEVLRKRCEELTQFLNRQAAQTT